MPALPVAARTGRLLRWTVRAGDIVAAGDVVAEIEIGRTVIEVEAETAGRVRELLVAEGNAEVQVDAPIAVLAPLGASGERAPDEATATMAAAALTEARAPGGVTVREALRTALTEEMRRDPAVLLAGRSVTEGGPYKVTYGLRDIFGADRVIDLAVSAETLAGLAVGAAWGGLRPVIELHSFATAFGALEQIVQSAATSRYLSQGQLGCPVVFRGPSGPAPRVGARMSQPLGRIFAAFPGLKVVQPSTPADAGEMLAAAIRDPDPVIFLESELLYGRLGAAPEDAEPEPLDRARIVRPGRDATLVSFGAALETAFAAAEALARDGAEIEVIDLRSLRPLDTGALLESVRRTGRCVTVEDGPPGGAIGDTISRVLMQEAFGDLKAPVRVCTGPDVPRPYSETLEALTRITEPAVTAALREILDLPA